MAEQHTLTSFDASLSDLTDRFRRMGEMAVDMCDKATKAYLERDRELALLVVERDLDVDVAFEQLRAACFEILLRFQPLASDLRLVMAIEHSVEDLERVGDHAKNMARRVISGSSDRSKGPDHGRLSELAAMIVTSMTTAVAALVNSQPDAAERVIDADGRIDALHKVIFDAAMVKIGGADGNGAALVQDLFVAKSLERIGDHATNIAEEVLFLSRGAPPGATRNLDG